MRGVGDIMADDDNVDFGSMKVVGIDAENQTMTMAGTPI